MVKFLRKIYQNYNKHDAILLPSLLKSFSSNYIEANYGKYIFTSNKPFSTEICGDLGIYFNPYSSKDIFQKIKKFIEFNPLKIIQRDVKRFLELQLNSNINPNEKFYNSIIRRNIIILGIFI